MEIKKILCCQTQDFLLGHDVEYGIFDISGCILPVGNFADRDDIDDANLLPLDEVVEVERVLARIQLLLEFGLCDGFRVLERDAHQHRCRNGRLFAVFQAVGKLD